MDYNLDQTRDSIAQFKTKLKKSSINNYMVCIRRCQELFETDTNHFMMKPNDVLKKIEYMAPTSRRNFMIAIIAFLESINQDHTYDHVLLQYKSMVDDFNKQYYEEQVKGELSDRHKKNMVNHDDIKKLLKVLDVDVSHIQIKHKMNMDITSGDRSKLRVWLLFHILTTLPTRLDYSQMKFVNITQYKKLKKLNQNQGNYLVKQSNLLYFYFNDYKTDKTYGENIIEIDKPLKKKLNLYLKLNNYINNDNIMPLSRNAISHILTTKSNEIIGKRVSAQILRKFYVSDKYNQTKVSQEKDASLMAHSVGTQQLIYNKKLNE